MKSDNTVWHCATVTRARRESMVGHRSAVVWFTGLSASGKSTRAHYVEEQLHHMVDTAVGTFEDCVDQVLALLARRKIVRNDQHVGRQP